jgi:hypothetical protein
MLTPTKGRCSLKILKSLIGKLRGSTIPGEDCVCSIDLKKAADLSRYPEEIHLLRYSATESKVSYHLAYTPTDTLIDGVPGVLLAIGLLLAQVSGSDESTLQ